jgi:hypothetical protein
VHPRAGHELRRYAFVRAKSKQFSRRAPSCNRQEYDLLLNGEIRLDPMKTLSALLAVSLVGIGTAAFAAEPSKDRDQQQVIALSNEVQGQQKAIAENQAKIDEKMAGVAEALRLAKIYASRAGR